MAKAGTEARRPLAICSVPVLIAPLSSSRLLVDGPVAADG
jgi:hypothetical protein